MILVLLYVMVYVSTRMYADYTNLTFTAYIHTYIHNLFKMHLNIYRALKKSCQGSYEGDPYVKTPQNNK